MADKYEWPANVPTWGTVINEIDAFLRAGGDGTRILVGHTQLKRWQDCLIECGALLDPDNPPSTPGQLARMKWRS